MRSGVCNSGGVAGVADTISSIAQREAVSRHLSVIEPTFELTLAHIETFAQ